MKVVFITEKRYSAHNLGAEWIFVLCKEGETVSEEIEVVDLNDPELLMNPELSIKICPSALTLYRYIYKNKSAGAIAYGDWLSEQRFDFITPFIKLDLLVILADYSICSVDMEEITELLYKAVEELNIPIVFYNKNSGEYAIFGVSYEMEKGFFHFCI